MPATNGAWPSKAVVDQQPSSAPERHRRNLGGPVDGIVDLNKCKMLLEGRPEVQK